MDSWKSSRPGLMDLPQILKLRRTPFVGRTLNDWKHIGRAKKIWIDESWISPSVSG